ncbi:MAG: hypothetical protein WCF82_07245 [Microcoleus sp.]
MVSSNLRKKRRRQELVGASGDRAHVGKKKRIKKGERKEKKGETNVKQVTKRFDRVTLRKVAKLYFTYKIYHGVENRARGTVKKER